MRDHLLLLGFFATSLLGTLVAVTSATEIHVPTDQPTIESAIQAASAGDTVTVACGTYFEHGVMVDTSIHLRSEDGTPDCVTIDAEEMGRVMVWRGLDATAIFEGITFTGGSYPDSGGAVLCDLSSPLIRNCRFNGNEGSLQGGAVYFLDSAPVMEDCVVTNNTGGWGGGLYVRSSDATISNCVLTGNHATNNGACIYFNTSPTSTVTNTRFVGNTAGDTGGTIVANCSSPLIDNCLIANNSSAVNGAMMWALDPASTPLIRNSTIVENTGNTIFYVVGGAVTTIERSILAFNTAALDLVFCTGASVDVLCSNLYGNAPGDWTNCIGGQSTLNDNLSTDPLFCDLAGEDYSLHEESPCLPGNHPDGADCGLIGAFGEGCAGPGACCFPDGECRESLLPSLCEAGGGTFLGVGVACEPESCPDLIVGACCVGGICVQTTDGNCDLAGGTYLGDDTICSPNPCPGACCFDDVCGILTLTDCLGNGGEFIGDPSCEPETCIPPVGACCLLSGSCVITVEESCVSNGHSYLGDDTQCDPDPCPTPTGACCLPNETCVVLAQIPCETNGWSYIGNGIVCEPLTCSPSAAPGSVIPDRVLLTYPSPNPTATTARFTIGLPELDHVRVAVYDVAGALVARLAEAEWEAGMHEVEWDLRDAGGVRVPQGTYYIRLQTPSMHQTHSVVVLR